MESLTSKMLDSSTWKDFEELVNRHNGIWGGCWCISFHHAKSAELKGRTANQNREEKESRVKQGTTHNALVYAGESLRGWCQFGTPGELPKGLRSYGKLGVKLPEWRITCFFVDSKHRREGVSRFALKSALKFIAESGGGTVDAYPNDTMGNEKTGSFLWSGTLTMFSDLGFKQMGNLGPTKLLMRLTVTPDMSF